MAKRRQLYVNGFTLIELLVVISIIAILSGLVMAGYGSLEKSRARAHTGMVIAIASTGVERAALDLGGAISGAPHPLNDVLDLEARAPHLAGLENVRVLGVNGAGLRTQIDDGEVSVARDRNDGDIYHGDVWHNAWERAVRTSLGGSYDRLVELQAIRNPRRIPIAQPDEGVWLIQDSDDEWRLRQYDGVDGPGHGNVWQPGRVLQDGEWRAYVMPGPTVIDAWGTEIIMIQDAAGRTNFISAGPDGSFVTLPDGELGEAQNDNIQLFGD